MRWLITVLICFVLHGPVQAQSLKFYGTNSSFGIRFWAIGGICQPRGVGLGVQYVPTGDGGWKGYLATVKRDHQNHYVYDSRSYGGPINGFTIVKCTNQPPYSLSAVSDKMQRFTLTIPNGL